VKQLPTLSEREREILSAVVRQFVLTANPVGSRQLLRRQGFHLSAATIRNVMADLEEMGLLCHPHKSAGRVPSDLGYRMYVDDLMESRDLSPAEREAIEREYDGVARELDDVMAVTARVLSTASKLLAVVLVPNLDEAVLRRIDLVRVAENRVLVVISLDAGPVKTIMAELKQAIPADQLKMIEQGVNQRLSGLSLAQVRAHIGDRIRDLPADDPGLVRFFLDSADRLFSFADHEEMKIGGRAEVLAQPEFSRPESIRGIIELIEDKDIILHLLQSRATDEPISISIGSENVDARARDLSVLTSSYYSPQASGKFGVIGPTRMEYSRLKSLLEFTARMISNHLSGNPPIK